MAAARVVATPSQRVVVMRDQHPNLLSRAGSAQRASALDADQLPLMRALKDSGARSLSSLRTVNAVTATVSPAERARRAADPDVAAVVPDRRIPAPSTGTARSAARSAVPAVGAAGLCPKNPDHPLVEPEALHLTKADAAQPLGTGKGVKVAFWTDGIDVNDPEFVRPDGTGEAIGGGEGFGDAGAIAAQGARTYDMAKELTGIPYAYTVG